MRTINLKIMAGLVALVAASPLMAQGIVWEDSFTNGVAPTVEQEDAWNAFEAELATADFSGLQSVTMSGSEDLTGITCSDPTLAAQIADMISSETTAIIACDGHDWHLCNRGGGWTELWIDPPSSCSGSNCPNPGYIVRPTISTSNANWGGVGTATCNTNPSQTMRVDFDGAVASTLVTFDTSITFTNGFDGSVNVELTCNGGNPLSQDADISADGGVQFSVDNLDIATRTCSIALSGLASGYELTDASDDCTFSSTTSPALAMSNTCALEAAPVQSNFAVDVDWVGVDDGSISQFAAVELVCSPASADTGSVFGTVSSVFAGTGDDTYSLDFYPTTAEGGALCTVIVNEESVDSAVESMVSCGTDGAGILFNVGDEEGECSVTMTAFFEGIPTLSQYGMAIMVLLMLGVGFVGFRRFV